LENVYALISTKMLIVQLYALFLTLMQ